MKILVSPILGKEGPKILRNFVIFSLESDR